MFVLWLAGTTAMFWGIGADNAGLAASGATLAGIVAGLYGGWYTHGLAVEGMFAAIARMRAEEAEAQKAPAVAVEPGQP